MPKPTNVPGLSRRAPLAVAGPLLVRARLADVRQHERVLAADGEPDEDAVHDMRVAARRLRAALEVLGDDVLAPLEDEVEALQDALGGVRDVQVLRGWVREHVGGRARGRGRLVTRISAGLPDVSSALREALHAWRDAVAPTILELSAAHAGGGGHLGGPRIARAVRRRFDAVDRRIPPVLEDPSPETAHRLRIAAKKLRYLAELARPGRRAAAKALLAVLEPLQERLGDLHDADVRAQRLEALVRDAPEVRDAVRTLLAQVRSDREREAGALVRDLRRWRELELVRLLRTGFRPRRRRVPTALQRPGSSGAGRPSRAP